MKRLILAALVMASAPAFADETSRAAQVTVSVAEQIRVGHPSGDYADLGSGRQTVALPWGTLLAFAGTYPDTRTTRNFGLHIDGLSSGDCMAYVRAIAPAFQDVWIADASPSAVGGSVYRSGHLDLAALDRACHAHDQVGMDLITH
ncbi:hypothetical protein [Dyella sp. 2HG41-7]|uniref:hypothetical protein n=1 Tax=Dyella sp. 2HG41-7 TaxID=2883239 RepID=UPI001F2C4C6C|nr:hypothetical protein [Dyella sp. 2HG41-7]